MDSQRNDILASVLAGIPSVARAIAGSRASRWSRALDAARRSYLRSGKNMGFSEEKADIWVAAIMFHLRLELKKALATRDAA